MPQYYRVDRLSEKAERELESEGKHVRNYGRLKKSAINALSKMDLSDGDPKALLDRRNRPWRMNRFIKDLIESRGNVYGEASYREYTVRVLDAGISQALGKGTKQTKNSEAEDMEAELDFAPWDHTDVYWSSFELWRELLGTTLLNVLPDRAFSLYVYAKDSIGDDVPLFYMELQIGGDTERHSVVWEMDQVLPTRKRVSRSRESEKTSEYASAYQKVYFFLNWDEAKPRRVDKIVLCDLSKPDKNVWDTWMSDQHDVNYVDAIIAILITLVSLGLSICSNELSISLVAGIIVAGIAAEEWMPPQTILFGAIARFFGNESLALRLYYRTTNALSTRRVLISVLGSIGEIATLGGAAQSQGTCWDKGQLFESAFWDDFSEKLGETPNLILTFASFLNVLCLLQTAFAGVYAGFSQSDYPSEVLRYPKCYLPRNGYLRQVMDDLKPVEEYCSVFRPLLHWRRGVANRYLGQDIDLASPGSPPSMVCYWLTFPASAKVATNQIYGHGILYKYIPLVIVEQFMAFTCGIAMLVADIFVTLVLAFSLFLSKTHLVPRTVVRYTNSLALKLLLPLQSVAALIDGYNFIVAKSLKLDIVNCRGRATAALYRFPLIKNVRTGQSSNHAWKFGDWANDANYYRCSDIVIINPRISKLGMIESNKLVFKRHKLLWNTFGGVRYESPILGCGDNASARRSSITEYKGKSMKLKIRKEPADEFGGKTTKSKQDKPDENEFEFDLPGDFTMPSIAQVDQNGSVLSMTPRNDVV